MKKILLSLFFVIAGLAPAQAQAPFYQGKTITIIVGYLAGDGYDIWARLLVAHMGKHIPGNPGMIAQNMPGAGSMIAANHVYNVAKPDGLTMASIGPSLYQFGKLRGYNDETRKYAYGKIFNAEAYSACTNMPRFGHKGILTEAQIKDVVALLVDPESPVNK